MAVALQLESGTARIWHSIPREDASQAQNNINSKRRRDGKTATGRWITPIFANIEPENGGGYQLTVANDPDREVHDAME